MITENKKPKQRANATDIVYGLQSLTICSLTFYRKHLLTPIPIPFSSGLIDH